MVGVCTILAATCFVTLSAYAELPGSSPTAAGTPTPNGQKGAPGKLAKNVQSDNNIISALQNAGRFKTLLSLIQAAGLTEKLQKSGPYTLLAPTDAAFARLASNTVEDWLKPEERDLLDQVVNLHLVNGRLTIAEILKRDMLSTLEGTELDVDADNERKTVQIDDAQVESPDIEASNGIIQGIDRVLLP